MLPQPIINHNTRKTRIVCVSDTHSASPADGAFKLPKGDVLIHAGDRELLSHHDSCAVHSLIGTVTNQGSLSELRKTVKWIEDADFEAKVVIAGKSSHNDTASD